MTDILCTYEDGTTEMRAATSPALFDGGPDCDDRWPVWSPADVVSIARDIYGPAERRITLVFRDGLDAGIWLARGDNGSRGVVEYHLRHFQEWRTSKGERVTPLVWTAQWGWRPCKVETTDEQLARLTRTAAALHTDVRSFIRDLAKNYDHDEDAHKHGTSCFVCKAEELWRRVL